MRLQDLKIGYKILGIILVFGMSSIATTVWQNSTMHTIQVRYQQYVKADDPALQALATMNQQIPTSMTALYNLAVQDCPSDYCEAAQGALQEARAGFLKHYGEAIQLKPALAGEWGPIRDRYEALYTHIQTNVVPFALLNDDKTVKPLAADVNRRALSLSADIRDLIKKQQKANLVQTAQLDKAVNAQTRASLIVSGLVTALITALAALVAFADITRMLGRLTLQMSRVSEGKLDEVIVGVDRKDEIGKMAKTLGVFQQSLLEAETLKAEASAQKARQDAERKETMLGVASEFEKTVGGIVTLLGTAASEMQVAATQLTASAEETSAQSAAVSAAAEETGANVTSLAGAADELGASVSEIGRQVETSAQMSTDAVLEAERAGQVVTELRAVARDIGGVIDVISGLANQTNLLALNATIESARAGEAGKGFAVVASEVKHLAGQTSRATTEISEKITQIQETTSRAVEAIEGIGGTIRRISETGSSIAAAIEQQNAATVEIVQAVNQASIGTTEVSSNITGVARAAETTGAAASQVLSSAGALADHSERLAEQVATFLATVRAA